MNDEKKKKINPLIYILILVLLGALPLYRFIFSDSGVFDSKFPQEDQQKIEECVKQIKNPLGIHYTTCTFKVAAEIYSKDPIRGMAFCMQNPLTPLKTKNDELTWQSQCQVQIEAQLPDKLPQKKAENVSTQEEVFTANNVIELPLPSNDTFVFPGDYSVTLNKEVNPKGSTLSYDVKTSKESFSTPYFSEIDFFTEDSIKKFNEQCKVIESEGGLCFQGEYPNLDLYNGQKKALKESKPYKNYELKQFGFSNYLVANQKCTGDACIVRNYTTFIGDLKVDILIVMDDKSQVAASDLLFSQLKVIYHDDVPSSLEDLKVKFTSQALKIQFEIPFSDCKEEEYIADGKKSSIVDFIPQGRHTEVFCDNHSFWLAAVSKNWRQYEGLLISPLKYPSLQDEMNMCITSTETSCKYYKIFTKDKKEMVVFVMDVSSIFDSGDAYWLISYIPIKNSSYYDVAKISRRIGKLPAFDDKDYQEKVRLYLNNIIDKKLDKEDLQKVESFEKTLLSMKSF